MRKFLCSAVVVVCAFSVATADEFFGTVKKIEDGKVTFARKAKKGEKAEDMTLPLAKDAKMVKGTFDKETKSVKAGDALDKDAVTALMTKGGEKGVTAWIVTDADNKAITELRFTGGGKKKAGN